MKIIAKLTLILAFLFVKHQGVCATFEFSGGYYYGWPDLTMHQTFSNTETLNPGGFPFAQAEFQTNQLNLYASWTLLQHSSSSDASPRIVAKAPLYDLGGYLVFANAIELGAALRFMDYRVTETFPESNIVVDVHLKTFIPLVHLGLHWKFSNSLMWRLRGQGISTGKNTFFDVTTSIRWNFASILFVDFGGTMHFIKMSNDDIDGTLRTWGPEAPLLDLFFNSPWDKIARSFIAQSRGSLDL